MEKHHLRFESWTPDRRRQFLRALYMLSQYGETQYIVYKECVLGNTTPRSMALHLGTTIDNVRMARMRARAFMKKKCGSWVEED